MQTQAGFAVRFNFACLTPHANRRRNPRISSYVAGRNFRCTSALKCQGIGQRLSYGNGAAAEEEEERIKSVGEKDVDVATVGNLCVDIVLNVPKLPPKAMAERKAYMEELAKSSPDKEFWEAGGNCNVAIAAARLGLNLVTIGHVGDEIYGRFLLDVLRDEGIAMAEMDDPNAVDETSSTQYETLLCWVLVDPQQRHGFCSRADFSNSPAFWWMQTLSEETKKAIRRSKILFCNGYGFDELSPRLLTSVLDCAIEEGTAIFFDPGPRGKSLINGSADEQIAFDRYLRMSDVLLLTSEEAEQLTGIEDPILAAKELLREGTRTEWVIIKMGSRGSILVAPTSISCAPAFNVDVIDTVGCGDSFVAAVAFGYIHEMPSVSTLTIANAVGAATALGCGAGRNVANLKRVVELLGESSLNEDDGFWEPLLKKHPENEITLLTQNSLKKSSCEILTVLEPVRAEDVGTCNE
ncbi:fructokinase-1-like [Andrographis paniculata]|uniref:fructokinase-1-like n=1 Tax=Andrographis paniculata TaxID=175694 RepID=UPI0021E7AC1A|nr:fructokinase-1-like [Andrographis paniculata]